MKVLTRLFGGSGLGTIVEGANRHDSALPSAELYDVLWTYYLNNGLYDSLREAGYRLENRKLQEIYNPAQRAVEFFVDTVWPGPLEKAHPLQIDSSKGDLIADSIRQIWIWSNWAQRKAVAIRWAGITGNVFIRVARPLPRGPEMEAPQRVFMQLIRPRFMTYMETDERDYITLARLDIPQTVSASTDGKQTGMSTTYQTELWERGRLRIWHQDKGPQRPVAELGEPVYEVDLEQWGLDFIPIVHAKHHDLGDDQGVGAYTLQLSKINELNRLATRLHQILFRHNDVTWALEANMMDPSGRPIPPPRLRNIEAPDTDVETVEMGGERFYRLPGMAKLTSLIPQLNYGAHLDAVVAQMEEIERDLPQLAYYKLKDLPEMSGIALRTMLMPALAKARQVRGSMEESLVRAHKMALTIGREVGAFTGEVGEYERGDFDHHFVDRAVLPVSRHEAAELAVQETSAGIPLRTSLRMSGWTEEQLDQMEEDQEAEQSQQSQTLASGILQAQAQMNSPQASNGLEQPGNGQPAPEEVE